ncbi:MAG: EcsC family protein [Solirubrobacteraceae bacterium]|nr:EcsC family protein [Solirubrobacteraceae bacterium]
MPLVSAVIDRVTSAGSDVAERFLRPSGLDGQRFFLDVLEDLRADPTYALETIALRSVEVHGAAAKAWLAESKSVPYSQEQLAKIAVKRSTNLARLEGATLGFGGFLTVAPDLAALVYILTREVVFVAAAYGHDPTHPDRAAELLVVTQVYGSIEEAQAGLDRRGERIAVRLAKNQVKAALPGSGAKRQRTLSERLIRYAGRRAAKRYGGRLVPGIGAVLGAIDNGAAARETGERAIEFYRPHGTVSRGRLRPKARAR